MKIGIGSKNPVKINATKLAFQKVWPDTRWSVTGYDVPSMVADQPMSDLESITGATNRSKAVMDAYQVDFSVGIEGGLQQIGNDWFDCGWVVIFNRAGVMGIGSSARVQTPEKMMTEIFSGKELAQVIDDFFQTENARQSSGHFGLMTNNNITRTSGYVDGVVMALVPFLHPHLF
jgi:inosine/xanthosine triphosphatase